MSSIGLLRSGSSATFNDSSEVNTLLIIHQTPPALPGRVRVEEEWETANLGEELLPLLGEVGLDNDTV